MHSNIAINNKKVLLNDYLSVLASTTKTTPQNTHKQFHINIISILENNSLLQISFKISIYNRVLIANEFIETSRQKDVNYIKT